MQIVRSQNNIFEKVLRDKEGRLIRARFEVYEIAGKIKAKLLDWEYFDIKTLAGKVLSLAGFIAEKKSEFVPKSENPIASSFFVKDFLYIAGTKARAPTF
jgi:hypothetical protein